MSPDISLASEIKRRRKELGLRQSDLAVEIGISRSHVGMIEKGLDLPGRDTLVALLNYLSLPLDLIAAGRGQPHGGAQAMSDEEAVWLHAFRNLEPQEREPLLRYVLTRAKPASN